MLLRESTGVLMEGVPAHLSYDADRPGARRAAGRHRRPRPARLEHGRRARRLVGAPDARRRQRVAARARGGAADARAATSGSTTSRCSRPGRCRRRAGRVIPVTAAGDGGGNAPPRSAAALTRRTALVRRGRYSQRAFLKRT